MRKLTVFLSVALGVLSLSGCPKRSEKTSDPHKKNPKRVDFMGETKKSDDRQAVAVFPKKGAMGTLKLHLVPSKTKGVNVVLAPLAGGVQPSAGARNAVMTSLLSASLLVGKEMDTFAVKIEGSWEVECGAMQAALAASMMAAMTGSKIKPEVALVGAINPDGTIGPVSGLPKKLQMAMDAGKKTFGYPAGQGMAWDTETKTFVDLGQIAEKGGVKLVPLPTVYSAFRTLTGAVVDLPKMLDREEMKLSKELQGQIIGMASNWHKTHAKYAKMYKKVYVAAKPKTKKWKAIADKYNTNSAELIKKGAVSAGYDYSQRGGAFAYTSYWSKRFDKLDKKKDLKGMLKAIDDFKAVGTQLQETMKSFRQMKPESRGDLLALVSAWEQLVGAWSYKEQGGVIATETLAKINYLISKKLAPSMDQGRLYTMLDNTTLKYSMATLKSQKAVDFSKFVGVKGSKFIIQLNKFQRIAKVLKAVAKDAMAFAHLLYVEKDMTRTGRAKGEIKAYLMGTNNNFLQAVKSFAFPEAEAKEDNFENTLASIASYTSSYFNNAMLYLKHISLEMRRDASGTVEIKRKKALDAMLDAAEKNVLQQAALSKKYAGVVPASAKFFYNIGLSMKDQKYALKVKALEMFWKASMECQLSILMAQ